MLVGFAVAGWITDNYKTLDGGINGKWFGLFLQEYFFVFFCLFYLIKETRSN
jgi:hypothetical protein